MTEKEIMDKPKIEKASDWFNNVLPGKLTANPDKAGGFNGSFTFKITGDTGGEWTVSINGKEMNVKEGEIDPNAAFGITIKDEDFVKLMNGQLSGQTAFMTGKLKFKGSMGTAMKLQGLLF
jgi:putative sterol carrier protein